MFKRSELYDLNIDIASCLSYESGQVKRIYCLTGNSNYCCYLTNSSDLYYDSRFKTCCTLEQYNDQQWVLLTILQGNLLLMSTLFLFLVVTVLIGFIFDHRIDVDNIERASRFFIRKLLEKNTATRADGHDDGMQITVQPSIVSQMGAIVHEIKRKARPKKAKTKTKTKAHRNSVKSVKFATDVSAKNSPDEYPGDTQVTIGSTRTMKTNRGKSQSKGTRSKTVTFSRHNDSIRSKPSALGPTNNKLINQPSKQTFM